MREFVKLKLSYADLSDMSASAVWSGSPLGPHLTQCRLGRGLPLSQVAS